MTGDRRFSLETAFEAAERDELATWVGEFLASRGSDNAELAAGLAQRPRSWLGPVRVPVDDLEQLAGPDDPGSGEQDMLCPIEPEEWESDVDDMESSIEQGWEPPPLLIEHRDGRLLVQDGNHRYEALQRAGETHAWVIIWSDDEADRDRLADRFPAAGSHVPAPES